MLLRRMCQMSLSSGANGAEPPAGALLMEYDGGMGEGTHAGLYYPGHATLGTPPWYTMHWR